MMRKNFIEFVTNAKKRIGLEILEAGLLAAIPYQH